MLEFLLENLPMIISSAVGFIAATAMFIASLFEGHSLKKSLKNYEENLKMIIPNKNREDFQQTFSEFVKDYQLNEKTGELVEKENPRNVQAEIDSYKDVALNVQLAKLLPDPEQKEGDVDEYYHSRSYLDELTRLNEFADEVKDYYKLPQETTLEELKDYVDKIVNDYKSKIIDNKEVKTDETSQSSETESK